MNDVQFTTHPAPDSLDGKVRELWHLSDTGKPHRGLPKPYVEVVISLHGIHWWRAAPGMAEHRYATSWVTPVQSGPRYARAVGRRKLIGARLEPWAAQSWLGPLPTGEGNPPPDLSDYVGADARRLREALLAAKNLEDMFQHFGHWLASQPGLVASPRLAPSLPISRRAIALAKASQATPRHYRRLFSGRAGLSPKRWLLLHRLDMLLRDTRLADPAYPLASLAADHGFADQAHLTREMKRFTGATPGSFRTRATHYPPHMLLHR